MDDSAARELAERLYRALADGDGESLTGFPELQSFVDGQIGGAEQPTGSASAPQETSTVEFAVANGVATLRLNRPAWRNAINQAMADELRELAGRCAREERVRAVLLLGNGPAFTVGGDIDVFGQTSHEGLPGLLAKMTTPYHEALRLLAELDKPVVAGVHGAVAGGGLGLLHCADVAFAAAGTRFATGFCAIGLTGDGGSTWYLPRLVGVRRAAEMYLRNRVLDATEAAEWGLVNKVVPADELERCAVAEARRLAEGPTRAYAELRRLLRGSFDTPLGAQLDAERGALCRSAATEDAARAIQSFLHKAEPTFQGR